MANMQVEKNWSPIRILEPHELARGGLNGNMNEQAKALAERTELLKDDKADRIYVDQLVINANNGLINFKTEIELKAFIPTQINYAGKALDTKKVWLWDGTKWNDTGLSELDIAKDYSNELTKNNTDVLKKELVRSIKLPLLPTSNLNKNLSILTTENDIALEAEESGDIKIFGKKLELEGVKNFIVPSIPGSKKYEIYMSDGTKIMSLDESGSEILGLDNSSAPIPIISESSAGFKDPSFYTQGGKTYKADESGVSVFSESELINPIGVSNNAVLTVANSGFNPSPIQAILTKSGHKFPNPDRVLVVIPFYGQSLSVGSGGLPIYTTVDKNPFPNHILKFKNFSTIFNRTGGSGIIRVIEPSELTDFDALHATDFGNNYTGQAIVDHFGIAIAEELNKASDGCVMRSLFYSAGIGGTLIANLGRGSDAYQTMLNTITAAKAIAKSKGWSVIVPAFCFQHGESDSTSTTYKSDLINLYNQLNADIKAITEQSIDLHCYLANPASPRGSTQFRSSQAMYELNRDQHNKFTQVGGVYEGAVRDTSSDWTHMNTNGYMQLSYRYAAAFVEDLKNGFGSYKAVYPKSITRINNIIDIEFNVPNPPLQFKATDIIPLAENFGFSYVDSTSSATITNVELLNTTTVRITLSATPTGASKKIRAGYIFSSGNQSYQTRQRTNLCDSTQGQTPLGEDLNRFCLTFEESVN